MNKPLALALAAALALSFGTADAQVRVSGFGQVVAGKTTGSGTNYPGTGFDDDLDFREGSLFAVQVSADLNERVSATGQILARGSESFDAELAWAYATFKLDGGWSIQAGRQRTPFFRYSDFLDVGYAYPWIAPPRAVYNLPFNNADAVAINWSTAFGSWFSQAKLMYGSFDGDIGGDNQGQLDDLMGLAWDLNYNDWLSLRAAYFTADVSLQVDSLDTLTATLAQFGLPNTARLVDSDKDSGIFKNVGFEIDRGTWLVSGEWTETRVKDSIQPINQNHYISGALRLGKFTPHLTWGQRKADPKSQILASLPQAHPLFPTVAGAVNSQALDDTYTGIGLRWDFASNVAFKADYTRYRSDIPSRNDANLIAVGVAFTF